MTTTTTTEPITVDIISSTQLQAFLVTEDNAHEVASWSDAGAWGSDNDGPYVQLESGDRARPGDWVMRAIMGSFFLATPEYFAKHYRPVDDTALLPSEPVEEAIRAGGAALRRKVWGDSITHEDKARVVVETLLSANWRPVS